MNKYLLFGVLMLWLIFATFVVNAFVSYLDDDTFVVVNPIEEVNAEAETDADRAYSLMAVFWNVITFQITGLPPIVSLIFFGIPIFINVFLILDPLIALLNAVIPF